MMPKYIDAGEAKGRIAIAVNSGRACTVQDIAAVIDAMPTADVAPVVHARWERQAYWDSLESGEPSPRCSACHETNLVEKPYCPNCGAKMDLEVNDDGTAD